MYATKNKNMQTFKINKNLEVVCEWKKTSMAFKHEATLLRDGQEVEKVKICYQNRTWERFEFDSVIEKLADKTGEKAISEFVKNRESDRGTEQLKSIGRVVKMGEILFKGDLKATNDWKERMLKAGLGNSGLIMPEDWNELNEEEKKVRLNSALAQIMG